MWCGTQPNHLRTEIDGAIIAIMRDVIECDMNRHGAFPLLIGGSTGVLPTA